MKRAIIALGIIGISVAAWASCGPAGTNPTAALVANPTSVISGGASTLTWSSTYSTSCAGTNFSTSNATSGNLVVNPTATTVYGVDCTNGTLHATSSATVTVTGTPTASLGANPTSIVAGQSSTLTWSSTNASTCTGTNFSTANAVSGSVAVTPSVTTTYSVNCGGATASATVTVTPPAPTASLSANPASIVSGGQSVLTWSSTNASSCAGTGFATGNAISGTANVTPTVTTTYSVNCGGAVATASVTVTGVDTRQRDSLGWVVCSHGAVQPPLSDAAAASLVAPMTENRASTNVNSPLGDPNHHMPSSAELSAFRTGELNKLGANAVQANPYAAYVTGGYTGNTDEIIQWAAIK